MRPKGITSAHSNEYRSLGRINERRNGLLTIVHVRKRNYREDHPTMPDAPDDCMVWKKRGVSGFAVAVEAERHAVENVDVLRRRK